MYITMKRLKYSKTSANNSKLSLGNFIISTKKLAQSKRIETTKDFPGQIIDKLGF